MKRNKEVSPNKGIYYLIRINTTPSIIDSPSTVTLKLSLTNRQPGYVLNARKGKGGSNWLARSEGDAKKGKESVLSLSVYSHSARFPRASRASDSFSLSLSITHHLD